MSQLIGVPRETFAGEKRVATVPEVVEKLVKLGFKVAVQSGAGDAANFSDDAYRAAGAEIVADAAQLWANSDIVFKVRGPSTQEAQLLREGQTLVSFLWPAQNPELMQQLAARKGTVLAMDSLPRMLSRAQKMDALTSMAGVTGYRAVIEAAHAFGRFLTGQITAAGKVPPAKVFIAGAGVAGLAAIGTAVGLGAIVRANDTRAEVADQVVSLGGEFVKVDYEEEGSGGGGYAKVMSEGFQKAQREMYAKQAREVDIIITTALIPGKPAPKLITAAMVDSMRKGSVVVDLAAEQGGNCDYTKPGEVTVRNGVTIIGYTDLPSRLATQSSQLYGTNLRHFLTDLTPKKDGSIVVNMEDDVIRGATVINLGAVTWPPPPLKVPAIAAAPAAAVAPKGKEKKPSKGYGSFVVMAIGALLLFLIGASAPPAFMQHLTVFVLACFIGYHVIWNVAPALHTPLMSVTNAISGIIVIGALLQIGNSSVTVLVLAGISVLIATINISGGFWVTQRMLKMFRRD